MGRGTGLELRGLLIKEWNNAGWYSYPLGTPLQIGIDSALLTFPAPTDRSSWWTIIGTLPSIMDSLWSYGVPLPTIRHVSQCPPPSVVDQAVKRGFQLVIG